VQRRKPGRPRPTAAERETQTAAALDALRRIVRALRLAAQQTRADTGISAAQLFVLTSLAGGDAASLTELGDRTLTDRSSVAGVVERLAAAGLVACGRSPADRRRTEVHITAEGRELLQRAPRAPTALLVEGLDGLGAGELASVAGGLTRLAAAMGLARLPAPMLFDDELGDTAVGDVDD
jgi:DNA-binding MarR family transcriptional regulator